MAKKIKCNFEIISGILTLLVIILGLAILVYSMLVIWPSEKYQVKEEGKETYRDVFPGSEFIGMVKNPEKQAKL